MASEAAGRQGHRAWATIEAKTLSIVVGEDELHKSGVIVITVSSVKKENHWHDWSSVS